MSKVTCEGISVSLDGYAAGPDQSVDAPLGIGGEALHRWALATNTMRRLHGLGEGEKGIDDRWSRRALEGVGATIMGRNMFGPVRGPWEASDWRGWWGDRPPFFHPVFVLTHHSRASLEMEGGTTFHFVTGGIHEALERARQAAAAAVVRVGGGAATVRQYLRDGLLDEIHMVVVPVLLGRGERLFADGLDSVVDRYEVVQVEQGERATHVLMRRTD